MIWQFHFWIYTQRTGYRVLKRYLFMFTAVLFMIAKRWK